jgi:geranylgeranyl diphosphate synthase type II
MYSIQQLTELVEKGIHNLTVPSEPALLYDPIKYTLASGGKRVRPVLVLVACNLYSDSIDKAVFPALAIELFHNFTLIHDDIMDNAPLRRNKPTVFAKWGQNIAILSGDALNVMAYQLLAKTDKTHLGNVLSVFNKIALGVCEGQQLDMDFETAPFVTPDEYTQMIELKTSVLIKGALQIGGIIGGATASDLIHLGDFGLNLGIAFQLQDDLLDIYGDSNAFGKQVGGDIVANKKTFLTIKALSLAKGKTLDLLNGYIKAENLDPDKKVAGVKDIYEELGVKKIAEAKIQEYYQKAILSFDKLKVNQERKNLLKCLADNIMSRSS